MQQIFDGTYTTAKGETGTFHLVGCIEFRTTSDYTYRAQFSLTTPKGAVLAGNVNGIVSFAGPGSCQPSGFPVPIDFTLTVTCTAGFKHATGTIHLADVWCCVQDMFGGPISGTLTGDVVH